MLSDDCFSMEIQKIDNQDVWDKWLLDNNFDSYLQSWSWGEILSRGGQNVNRLAVQESDKIIAVAQIIIKKLPLNKWYAFCPKGPVISLDNQTRQSEILEKIGEYLQSQGCIFLRIEPEFEWTDKKQKIKGAHDINPRATLILNIDLPEEKLLENLHSKTRYNLRLAQRKELRFENDKKFSVFWDLIQKTSSRDNFILHPEKSYQNIMGDSRVEQVTIYNGDNAIASGGFIGFGNTFVYLYGALDYEARQLMAPYLLQWSAIQLGKKLGYKYYDFFGVAPTKGTRKIDDKILSFRSDEFEYDETHTYAGITRFKLGFGGEVREVNGTFDLILSSHQYIIYKLSRRLRKIL